MEFHHHTLANGLSIAAECNPQAHTAAVGFFVNAGARDEEPELAGVSHFLEHMAFKGTPRRTADDVNREFDELGASYNACTSEEHTVFYAAVLPEHLERTVDLLADVLRPALRPEDFQTEKLVILEEIQMYEDQPPFGADEKCRALYFGPHPLGHSVLGTLQSIEALPVEAMRAYHRRRYAPGNVTLAAAGKLEFGALVRWAERLCGDWEPGEPGRAVAPASPRRGFFPLRKETAAQQYTMRFSPGPAATDPDRYAAKLLAMILGDETGSRLYWELVDPGLAEHAALSHGEYDGAGVMVTALSCDPADAAENIARVDEVYRRARQDGVTEAELAQARRKVSSRIVLSGERPRGRLFNVGADWVQRREYRSIRDDLASVAAIRVDDLAAVLAKYPLDEGTTVTIGPQ